MPDENDHVDRLDVLCAMTYTTTATLGLAALDYCWDITPGVTLMNKRATLLALPYAALFCDCASTGKTSHDPNYSLCCNDQPQLANPAQVQDQPISSPTGTD